MGGYLQSIIAGAARIGLDGGQVGVVAEAEEAHARQKIAAAGARGVSEVVEQKPRLKPASVTVAPRDRSPSLSPCQGGAIAGRGSSACHRVAKETGGNGAKSA
jgi:sRNA-binding protein